MTTEAKLSSPRQDQRIRMGERLREIRTQLGLTLADVAARSGLAVSTVSKVERGLMALTYDRFNQLADGLEIDIAALFSEHGDPFQSGGIAVARKGEFLLHETENYTYEMLFPELWNKTMTPMFGTLRPYEQMHFERFVDHPGEEFLYVLEGSVMVYLDGKAPVQLQAGESLYFDSRRGHLYASAGPENARILVVCSDAGLRAKQRALTP
ncbi:XRE family transcriptional regulator [Hwanghaeella grinnelliae]|uniref:XRE family transcriptional regulator n=1 Tax=Hwanghaeella grinnelliae TaxID=2500179 RepID=A0A437QTD7_9PROT|nr:XRE family transcriptional regulator [Hwanghaeella grinnelliae]RVU37777.1 XRE family transcriptional regulator [Hwanghaeella grinnelliae]